MTTEPYAVRTTDVGEMPTSDLMKALNPDNWRLHPPEQLEALAGVLQQLGWVRRVLFNRTTGHIVDGHARVEIANANGQATCPVEYCDLTPAEERLALASIDPITGMATSNRGRLAGILEQIEAGNTQVQDLLAYVAKEHAGLPERQGMHVDPGANIDRADEYREKWQTEPGQLWRIGRHRLLCGDATSQADFDRLRGRRRPGLMVTDPPYGVELDPWDRVNPERMTDEALARGASSNAQVATEAATRGVLMVTDPPYGVGYDPQYRADYARTKGHKGGVIGTIRNDDRADWGEVWALWKPAVLYAWHGGLHSDAVMAGLARADYKVRAQIIWRKPVIVMGRGHYNWQHEPCFYAVRKGQTAAWNGGTTASTMWDDVPSVQGYRAGENAGDPGDRFKASHTTQKPVELWRRPIRFHTYPGEIVADPFAGSGPAFVAAEQTGRIAYGMELEPKFVAVILERMAGMGLTPELEPAGG